MEAWGFAYKSNYAWGKDKIGLGRWNRSKHELLLIGTIGSPPCPAPGTQWESLQFGPRGKHSEKPGWQYELIESYFPNLPKIELNARQRRPGWDAWGLEASQEA
jgi:N6-adenosine-specific RNA methylase IME4